MTSSADERGKPGDRPDTTSGKPEAGPAKPGSAASSTMQPSATPKPSDSPKATEPAKPGATGPAAAAGAKAASTEPLKPSFAGAQAPKPAQSTPSTGAKDHEPKPSSTTPDPSSSATSSAASSAAGASSSSASAASAAAPKATASDASKTSAPTPSEPAKAAATGSSAVPPTSPQPASSAPKPEAPNKPGATDSSAIGSGSAKIGTGPGASADAAAKAAPGAARVKPEDALTDGPIIDLKANRSADPATAKPDDKTSPAKDDAAKRAAAKAPESNAPQTGAGFGSLVAAGLVGGFIGGFLMFLLSLTGMLSSQGDQARIDSLEKRVATLPKADAVTAIDRRLSAAETALKPLPEAITKAQEAASASPPSDLTARLDALDQRVSALQEEPARDQGSEAKPAASEGGEPVRLADLDVRLKALESKSQAQGGPAVPEEDLAPKLAALQSDVEARTKANEASDKALGQRIDQLQQSLDGRIAAATDAAQQAAQTSRQTAEAGKAQAEEAMKAADRRLQEQGDRIAALDKAVDGSAKAATVQATLRAVAVNRIADALVTGAPYAEALSSLRGSDGSDATRLEPLGAFADKGAPTAAALAGEFRPIADRIAAARRSARVSALAASGSIGDRLMSMAESVVHVKRVPAGGDAADSVGNGGASADEPEAKVQADLDRGRVDEAARSFAALPDDLKAQVKEFGARLKAVADARAAAQGLQSDAFKALAAPAATR